MADGNALNKEKGACIPLIPESEVPQLQRYRILIEAMQDGMIQTDISGIIQFANSGVERIFKYRSDDLKGKKLVSTLIFPPDQQVFYEILASRGTRECPQIEVRGKTRTGKVMWVKAGVAPIPDEAGKVCGMVIIFHDITRQKANERELVLARERAEESNRLKAHFLANLSHEIRTPMNGIMGFLQLLRELDLSRSEKESYIEIIHKSGERLLDTINDIVEMAMIESGHPALNISKFPVDGILRQMDISFRADCDQKRLSLEIRPQTESFTADIVTDESKLATILNCLMKNAVKFTSVGGVKLGYLTEGEKIIFYVKDTGIGIPADRIPSVFDRFVHGDMKASRPHEGAGLGLSIARGYAVMLGGSLHVETKEGEGSTFYLSLPVDITQKNQPRPGGDQPLVWTSIRGSNILVAEDDHASFLFLEALLRKQGAVVWHARSGKETMESLRNHPETDLILLDLKMPDMNGYETARAIREMNDHIPIIAQTGYALPGDRELALEAGCTDFITKPVRKEVLIEVMSKHIKKGRQ